MKNLLAFLLIITFVNTSLGQQGIQELINTDEQNSQWNSDFQNQDLETKIESLKDRFIADQDVYYTIQNPHGKSPVKKGYDEMTFARPLYLLNSPNSKPLILPNNPSDELVRKINALLKPENIVSIEFNDDIKSQAIYGARARHGVITITFNKTDHLRELREIAQ